MLKRALNRLLLITLLVGALGFGSGCGSSGFVPQKQADLNDAPGSVSVPPKVDFGVFVDNSGAVNQGYTQLQAGIKAFLSTLDQQGWDYHIFMNQLITRDYSLSGVIGSKYDPSSSPWTPPYPGASESDPGAIQPSLFTTLDQYSLPSGDRSLQGNQPGLATVEAVVSELVRDSDTTHALRKDAKKVIVILSFGDDNSGLNESVKDYATGLMTPSGTMLNFAPWKRQMQAKFGGVSGFQIFAAVSTKFSQTKTGNLCRGIQPYVGQRYQAVADTTIDLCTNDPTAVFSQIGSSLTAQRLTFKTAHLFIAQDADVSTVKITKHSGGVDSVIPQGATNGWEYLGYSENLYTIDYPAPLNLRSGFAFRLNGSAHLVGNETATVSYQVKGTKTAVVE